MKDWLRARSGWTILLVAWGSALTGGLLSDAMSWMFLGWSTASFASNLPMLLGGSLFMALCVTASALRRRRRED